MTKTQPFAPSEVEGRWRGGPSTSLGTNGSGGCPEMKIGLGECP